MMSAKILLPVTICAFAFWVHSAFSKESPEGQGTGSWTAGAGVYGGFGLESGKIRVGLELREEQERGGAKVWAERRGINEEAVKLLTPEQREKMAELTRPQALVRRGEGPER